MLIESHPSIHQKWVELYKNTHEYIYNVLFELEYSEEIFEQISDKFKSNDKFVTKTIIGKNSTVTKDRKSKLKKYDLSKYKTLGRISQRLIDEVKISVVITDKESFIMFPKIGNTIDTAQMFYSDNKDFHKFCLDYFEYLWNEAKDVDLDTLIRDGTVVEK